MSQHHVELQINGKPVKLVLGYDRPLRELFFFIEADKEVVFSSSEGHSLRQGLLESGLPEHQLENLDNHLSPVFQAIDVESLAHSEQAQLEFFSQALLQGMAREEIAEKLNQAKAFTDFNRIVTYPAFAA